MRERHVAAERINARAVLAAANITLGQDFFTLGASQVDRLLEGSRPREVSQAAQCERQSGALLLRASEQESTITD